MIGENQQFSTENNAQNNYFTWELEKITEADFSWSDIVRFYSPKPGYSYILMQLGNRPKHNGAADSVALAFEWSIRVIRHDTNK